MVKPGDPGRWMRLLSKDMASSALSRAIDHDGNLVDTRLSKKRDRDAAKQCFKQAVATVGQPPEQVTTDGRRSYPRAISDMLGNEVVHRTNNYLNNK